MTGLDSGGLENYLLRFLQYKASEFSEIEVYCKSGIGGQLESEYNKIPNVTIVKKSLSFFNVLDYIQLRKYFHNGKFDCVCDFTGNFAGLVLYMASLAGIKNRIVFYRGATDHFSKNLLKSVYNNFVKMLTFKYASSILSNSQAAFNYFFQNKKVDSRFEVIYNGIDAEKFLVADIDLRKEFGIPSNSFVIGHTGRFNYAKNHKVIIDVAKRMVKNYPDIYFILCGNGVKNNLSKVILELNIDDNVLLFENRSDIPLFLNSMDVYFFPSITEGQPNALIEAMLIGLPIVASNIDPIKETVVSEDFLYDYDDVEGFFNALEKLYLEGISRNKAVRSEIIDKFDHKKRFDQFFNKIIL